MAAVAVTIDGLTGPNMFRVFGLATRDYLHEWQMSVCFILGLAAAFW